MNRLSSQELYPFYLAHPNVVTDTRQLTIGSLFFALKGPSFNGNAFAIEALEKGAAYAVIDEPEYAIAGKTLLVTDVLSSLQQLAAHHRKKFDIPFLAITGSNGKTTTKELVTAVCSRKYRTLATIGNLNNHIGVPLTLLRLRPDHEFAIIEMGANHLHEIASYCNLAQPTHGLITNCGKAHLEGFGGEAGVRKGKGELFDYLRVHRGTAFVYHDAPYLSEMAQGIPNIIYYGSSAEHCTVSATLREAVKFLALDACTPTACFPVHTRLVGTYNLPNVLAAMAVGYAFGVDTVSICEALESYDPDNSRSQWLEKGPHRIVLDAYNANPSSMRAAIENFATLSGGQGILWLGAMKEMGTESAAEHEALVQFIGRWPWKQVVLVGEEFRGHQQNFPLYATATEALEDDESNRLLQQGPQMLLIKGSRGSRMEQMLRAFTLAD